MADAFAAEFQKLESPAYNIEAVTPDDNNDLANVSRALNVAASGNVQVTTVGGQTATVYIAAGIAFPIRATRVWSANTDATGIRSLY